MREPQEYSEEVETLIQSTIGLTTPTPGTYVFGAETNTNEMRMLVSLEMYRQKHELLMNEASISRLWKTTKPTVAKYIKRVTNHYGLPKVEEARMSAYEQYDELIQVWADRAREDVRALKEVRELMSDRNDLLGLKAPMQVEQTVVNISEKERELQDVIRQAERDELMRAHDRDQSKS